MGDIGDFEVVSYRRKRGVYGKRRQAKPLLSAKGRFTNNMVVDGDEDDRYVDSETILRKLHEAEAELRKSLFLENLFDKLKESLNALKIREIRDIVCYGLGRFSQYRSPKYQLALLLCLSVHCKTRRVYVYDPVFLKKEREILERLGFVLIRTNEEGKRIVNDNPTLVYMPHCPTPLTNNILYANWGPKLSNCLFMTNSFSNLTKNSLKILSLSCIDYLSRSLPYVTEVALRNDFLYEEAFNNLSIHVFLKQNIEKAPWKFWTEREEPSYRDEQITFITAKETEADARRRDAMNPNMKIVRSLLREIRLVSSEPCLKDNVMVQYILEQARIHRESSEVLCKAREELKKLAETYLCYLSSRRMCKEIQDRYSGKGERTIKETADLVGFKLPHDPK